MEKLKRTLIHYMTESSGQTHVLKVPEGKERKLREKQISEGILGKTFQFDENL